MGKRKNHKKFLDNLNDALNEEKFKFIYIDDVKTTYMVSNRGYVINTNYRGLGKTVRLKEEFNHGYKRIGIFHNGRLIHKRVHRLVAEAFLPNPENLPVVHHKDGNKTNNNVSNLEFTTLKLNTEYACDDGLMLEGEMHPNAKYTSKQIHEVCSLLEQNQMYISEITDVTGVGKNTINGILFNNKWKSISILYNISNFSKFKHHNRGCANLNTVHGIINALLTTNLKNKEIAKLFNVPSYFVNDIKQHKIYKKLTSNIDFKINKNLSRKK